MHSDDIAISVRNLTKTYRLFGHPADRIKQFFSLGLRQYHCEFTALKDVSFDIKRGETVGIIGRNGSGKSTLLQVICGILKPTSGTVEVNGRISALLELGAGFNPEFTGRENVFFQGALLGFTQTQMEERFEGIAAFADIGEFIDQPVRTYSSGMFVRLAFAVAVNVDPDILVIDEALAVGDQAFQVKCLERIDAIRLRGGTVVLVSHALEQVAHHCRKAYLLDHGALAAGGDVAATLSAYLHGLETDGDPLLPTELSSMADTDTRDWLTSHPWYLSTETRWGDGKARIYGVCVRQDDCEPSHYVVMGCPIVIDIDVEFLAPVARPVFGLTIKSQQGALLYTVNSQQVAGTVADHSTGEKVRASFRITPFLDSGTYRLSFGVVGGSANGIQPHDRRYDAIALRVEPPRTSTGDINMYPAFELQALA